MTYPDDIDPECVALCDAMNLVPGIVTFESCCGHGRADHEFRVWFTARRLRDLPNLLYWFDACHSGVYGWRVEGKTDCARSRVTFCVVGPTGPSGYLEADRIAYAIRTDFEPAP